MCFGVLKRFTGGSAAKAKNDWIAYPCIAYEPE